MNKTVNDYIWAFLMSAIKIILQAIAIIVLGRILLPEDFGLIGMISIFIAFSTMLVDSGMGASLFRKEKVEEIEYSTLFIYNLAISIFIYVILYITAPYISLFYKQETLISIIRVISLIIIINAISRCQYTKLLKDFKYKTLSLITISSNAIAITIAIILALKGFGVWSLVYMQISEMSITTLLYIISNKYFPSFRFSSKAFKEQFNFGISLFGATALKTISDNIQSNIIAKIMPLNITGCYVQAQRIQHVPNLILMSVLDKVMFPQLSIIKNTSILQNKFFQTNKWVSFLSISLSLYLCITAQDIIPFILTKKWELAGEILSILILIMIPDSIKICCRNMLKSLGHSKLILKNELILSVLIIISTCIFAQFGINIMVIGILGAYIIGSFYIAYDTAHKLNCKIIQIFYPYIKYICIYIPLAFLYKIITYFIPQSNHTILLLILTILYFALFLYCTYKLKEQNKYD